MQTRTSLFRSFHIRVALAIIASMLLIFSLSSFFIFKYSLDSQFEAIRVRLMVIARTAALMIDAKTLDEVPLTHEGVNSPAYLTLAQKLNKIKSANPQIIYIYTMKKTDEEGIWQFVVDPEPVTKKRDEVILTSYPGDAYKASRYPEMMKAFEGPSADKALTVDEWGTLLSGYAPIYDDKGKAVGMLGLDIKSDDIYHMQQQIYWRGLMVLGVGILLSLLIGGLAAQRVSRPVAQLTEGARQLSSGHLDYRVNVAGGDEIGDLAHTFNVMAMNLEGSRDRLLEYFYDVVKSLVKILELRDQYTRGHSEAVAEHAGKIAQRMGYSPPTVQLLKKMTLLHDIGKIGIRDTILNKNGTLTPEEWLIIKKHPVMGEEILKPILHDEDMLAVVRSHHERYDGGGYPDRLNGEKINIFAAIVTVADAYDAMISTRSYKSAMTSADAIQELQRHSGSQFHPKVVEVFVQILHEELL